MAVLETEWLCLQISFMKCNKWQCSKQRGCVCDGYQAVHNACAGVIGCVVAMFEDILVARL
jgi:hypothetical protein